MKISLEWLGDFLPQTPTAGDAADALTNGGLPVEVIEEVGDDTVIDVEVTSNRSDCLSHRGVARELSALLKLKFAPRYAEELPVNAVATDSPARVRIDAEALCPHYTAQVIGGVKIAPSPPWLVRRLSAIGVRAVNNVVDVTNYVMFELGQPLHAFDFSRVAGGEIRVREAVAGETLVSLDGHERKLARGMLVIADAQRPIALAGVMGGRDSEVTDATTDILLESARFDSLSIRKTARTLSMKSDSSYRYERGIDPQLAIEASTRAAALIVQLAGGLIVGPLVEAGAAGGGMRQLSLRATELKRVIGVEFDAAAVNDALTRLTFNPVATEGGWKVTIPPARLDVNGEIDLVEEVARLVGYHNIPIHEQIAVRVTPADERLKTINMIRGTLAACGYSEAVTVSFVTDTLAASFTPRGISLLRTSPTVRKADGHLRPSLLPGLLEALRRNESVGTLNAKLFEIGSAFWLDGQQQTQERQRVTWVGGDFREVRGALEAVLSRLDPDPSLEVTPSMAAGFSSVGTVRWDGKDIGVIGLLDSAISERPRAGSRHQRVRRLICDRCSKGRARRSS